MSFYYFFERRVLFSLLWGPEKIVLCKENARFLGRAEAMVALAI